MTDRQRGILIGCILGDGYISPKGKIRIEQSVKQKEYLDWKYSELHSLSYPSLPREISRPNNYSSIFFDLRQYFREWRSIFYQGGRKVFPDGLLLDPLSLAVWYQDDGCWTGSKSVISTESFDEVSISRIQQMFSSQFGIETIVGKNRKLLVRKNSQKEFYGLVSKVIVPSMKYKIPNPVTTCPSGDRTELLSSVKTSAPEQSG